MTSDLASGVLAAGVGSNAGPIGLLVVVLLGVATVLLIRNMDKRVKNLPKEFPSAADPAGSDPLPDSARDAP